MIADLRYALRQWLKSPGFAVTALLTIALCLGANLAIFAVINSVLLRPLPFPKADQLVTIYNTYPKAGVENDGSSFTNYYERRGNIPALSSLSIYSFYGHVVGETGSTELVETLRISPDFFATLGVNLAMGRTFTEEEAAVAENNGVVILTDAYWRQHFEADPNILGREIRVNGLQRKIVGILPPDFRFLSSAAQLILPIRPHPEQRAPNQRHSGGGGTLMIARLDPGATITEAQSQIDAHNTAVEQDDPQAKMMAEAGFRSVVRPLHAEHVRSIRQTLWLLQAGVLFLLVIGAVNLINLLLTRASGRAKEMAIRQSMGASRQHVVRQVLMETILLTTTGGLLGVLIGAWGTRLLEVLGANRLPLGARIAFDGWLALTGVIAAMTLGIIIALPIVWFNLSSHLANALQSESRAGTINRATQRLRHGFIVAQIAIAFVLLAGAALLAFSLKKVMAVAPGFRADHVLTGECTITWQLDDERVGIVDRLLESIRKQPGIVATGIISNLPLSKDNGKTVVTPKGYVPPTGQSLQGHYSYGVGGDYFSAIGIPLREGRFLTSADSQHAERVCVVDEDFARRYWPSGGVIGQRLAHADETDDAKLFSIVGVVGAIKQAELTEARGQGAVYLPWTLRGSATGSYFIVTRTTQNPQLFAATLRKLVSATHPDLAFDDVRTMEARVDESLIARRSPALLAGIFAGVALLLAAIGTYGVLSYAVAQRRREIGIRMALGAQREQISRQFLSVGLRLLGAGTLFGAIGAVLSGRAMQRLLYGVSAFSLIVFVGTAMVMAFVCLLACWLPALRAARVNPIEALRAE